MCDRATKITLKKTDTYTVTVRHHIGFYQLANKVAKRHFLAGMFRSGKQMYLTARLLGTLYFSKNAAGRTPQQQQQQE